MAVFKNSTNGYFLKALFFETNFLDTSNTVYTLKNEDHNNFPSFYRLYMESVERDPMEYEFATSYLAGWDHWVRLQECTWFKPYIERWRHEAEVRMAAGALKRLISISKSGGREAGTCNKYLLEKGWVPKEDRKRGRPSNEEIKQEAQRMASETEGLNNDLKRVGLVS